MRIFKNRFDRTLVLLLVLAGMCEPGPAFSGNVNFTVSPSVVDFETVKGAAETFHLSFYNQGESPLRVLVSVRDFVLDTDGVARFAASGDLPEMWARHVSTDKNGFRADPGKSIPVKAALEVPHGGTGGGCFAVVFYATTEQSGSSTDGGVALGAELATLFIGEISRTGTRKGNLVAAEINRGPYSEQNPVRMRFLVENTGTAHFRAKGEVLMRESSDKVIARVPLEGGTGLVLPGGERYFDGTWPQAYRFDSGRIIAEVRFAFKGGTIRKAIPLPFSF